MAIWVFESAPPLFRLGSSTVFLCNCPFYPGLISPLIPVGGEPLGRVLVEQMRKYAGSQRVRTMAVDGVQHGLDAVTSAEAICDANGHREDLKDLGFELGECHDSIGEDLKEFGVRSREWVSAPVDDAFAKLQRQTAIKSLLAQHPRLRSRLSPFAPAASIQTWVELAQALDGDTTKQGVLNVLGNRLENVHHQVLRDAKEWREQLTPCVESLAAASAFSHNLGSQVSNDAYIILTRDVNELLSTDRQALVETLAKLKQCPFIDLVIANPVYGGTTDVHELANALLPRKRASIWAGMGDIQNERDAGRYAATNSKRGTFGAASLFLFAGTASLQGHEFASSVPSVAKRIARDQEGPTAMVEPMFGPQPEKNLICDDAASLAWSDSTHESLAMQGGINAIRVHSTGSRAPMFGRTPCSLSNQMWGDSSRFCALLSANAVAYLDQVLYGKLITPARQRIWCTQASSIFFTPFVGCDGFKGEITPVPSGMRGTFACMFSMAVADPLEKLIVRIANA